jgi:hypothetical protein
MFCEIITIRYLPLPDQNLPFPGLKVWDLFEYKLCPGPNYYRYLSQDLMYRYLNKTYSKGKIGEK